MDDVIKKYIDAGFYIFPIVKDGKVPLKNSNGFMDATDDVKKAEKIWKKGRHLNIAMYPGASGHIVVDLDVKNGKNGIEEWDALCTNLGDVDTLTAETPSGGRHHIFKLPADVSVHSSSDKVAPGIDIRSTGGYILIEPSTTKAGSYFWDTGSGEFEPSEITDAPSWLIDLASKKHAVAILPTDNLMDGDDVEELRSALFYIGSDDYETWVQVGMAVKDSMPDGQGFGLWAEWSSSSSKFDLSKTRKKWDSFKSSGLTKSTIFKMAMSNGWVAPSLEVEVSAADVECVQGLIGKKVHHLPGILKDITDFIVATARRPQPELSAAAAITLCATIMGQKFRGSTRLRTNIQMINIAPTGAGKDHPRQAIKEIMMVAEKPTLMGGEHVFSSSGLLASLGKHPVRLFLLDEFGRTLIEAQNVHSTSGSMLTTMMTLYTSSNSIYFGAEYADQKNRPRLDVEYPCACFLASSSDQQFYEALDNGSSSSGFLSRFLVVESFGLPALQIPADLEPPQAIFDWIDVVGRVRQGLKGEMACNPITVKKDDKAKEVFDAFSGYADDMLIGGRHEAVAHLWSRAWAHADKLATIGTIASDPESDRVTGDIAEWAVDYTKGCVSLLTKTVEDRVSGSEYEKNKKAFLMAIRKAGPDGIIARTMSRSVPFSLFPKKARTEILEDLKDEGMIVSGQFKTSGRPSTRWFGRSFVDFCKKGDR